MVYNIGDIINIGYYGGFHNKEKIKAKAKVVNVDDVVHHNNPWITIHVFIWEFSNAYKTMFGYKSDLDQMVKNYNEWK